MPFHELRSSEKLLFCSCINRRPVQELNHAVNFVIGIKVHSSMDPLNHPLPCFVFCRCQIPAQ